MSRSTKPSRLRTLVLKAGALLCGYALWHTTSKYQKITLTKDVPLCFYNVPADIRLEAPEMISVTYQGTRENIFVTAFDSAIHVDAQNMHEGHYTQAIAREQIFLPESVRLLHYVPTEIALSVTKLVPEPVTS